MFHLKSDMTTEVKHNIRGGDGSPSFLHLLTPEAMGSWCSLASIVTLQPGESVGEHPHVDNGELYLVLTGKAQVTEDGITRELLPGDTEFCAHGHTHSIANHTDEAATFLALIVQNP